MDLRLIIRAIAVILLAGSAFACAVEVGRLGGESDSSATSANDHTDPLAIELARCSELGSKAGTDAACQAAWAKNRQHFFGTGRAQQGHQPDLFPALPNASAQKTRPKIELDRAPSAPLPNPGTAPDAGQQGR